MMSESEKVETPVGSITKILNRCIANFSDWWARELAVQKVRRHLKAIPSEMVQEVLTIKFKNANIYVSDSWKEVPRWKDFLEWLKVDGFGKMKRIETPLEADNFALESKCRAERRIVGNTSYGFIGYGKPAPAANVLVCYTDGVLKAIQVEPQSDGIPRYDPDEAYLVVI